VPQGEPAARCGGLIEALARRHGTPRFAPHVTLLGGIGSDDFVQERAAWLASSAAPFELSLASRATHRDEYYRAVVAEALPSIALLRLHHMAREAFDKLDDPVLFEPHLSLAYGDLPPGLRADIVRDLPDLRLTFRVDAVAVWSTEGEPEDWQEVARYPLTGTD
jgi:2'-5' RNA ligase